MTDAGAGVVGAGEEKESMEDEEVQTEVEEALADRDGGVRGEGERGGGDSGEAAGAVGEQTGLEPPTMLICSFEVDVCLSAFVSFN